VGGLGASLPAVQGSEGLNNLSARLFWPGVKGAMSSPLTSSQAEFQPRGAAAVRPGDGAVLAVLSTRRVGDGVSLVGSGRSVEAEPCFVIEKTEKIMAWAVISSAIPVGSCALCCS
jgi:hypothetical protein